MHFRIGQGYDIHKLVYDRTLIIGGVKIKENIGLLGHSDADVLSHALTDSILGAAGLPDIGHFFPDNDPSYKGVNSQELLTKAISMVRRKGLEIVNLDSTIVAEFPKMQPFISKMREKISETLNIKIDQIMIKATTNENLDAIGNKKAIAAHAICLLHDLNQ